MIKRLLVCLVFLIALAAIAPAGATGLASVYTPAPYSKLQTYWIGDNGAVRMVWKEHNGRWHEPFDVTPPGLGIPNSPVTSVWSVLNDQLETLWVDGGGTVNLVWTDHDKWHKPVQISPAGYFSPGAQLSGIYQPFAHELMVFGIDSRGVLKMMWKKDNGKWQTSADMSPPGYAVPGGAVSAVFQPLDQRTEIFTVGMDGRINLVWKTRDERWIAPEGLTGAGLADPHAQLSAVWYGPDNHIEVFWTDQQGALHTVMSAHNSTWSTSTIIGATLAAPGSSITAVYQPLHQHLEIFGITPGGGIWAEWKQEDGVWKKPFPLVKEGTTPTDTVARAVFQPEGNQLELFYIDAVGQLWDAWKQNDGAWSSPPQRLADIGGKTLLKPGDCSVYFHKWSSQGLIDDGFTLGECATINGITSYCAARDSYPAIDLYGAAGNLKRLICVQKYHEDTIGEQADHIVRGVEQGLTDALIAAAPYLGPATEAVSCLNGVVFACAALGLDLADALATHHVLPVPDEAIPIAQKALDCANGGYVACAELGQEGLKEVSGIRLPAADITQTVVDVADCKKGTVAACARLGQQAAEAAGLSDLDIPKQALEVLGNGQNCLIDKDEGASAQDQKRDTDEACRQLGLSLAGVGARAAGVNPDLVDATQKGLACARGDDAACRELGLAAARALVPKKLQDVIAREGLQCLDSDPSACFDIAIAAADASGIPTGDIVALHRCANGGEEACVQLASSKTGIPIGSTLDTAKGVSRCADGDVQACIDLGRSAAKLYDPNTGAAMVDKITTLPTIPHDIQRADVASFTDWLSGRTDIPAATHPADGVNFSGDWSTKVQNGTVYAMTLSQDPEGRVTGTYSAGTITDGVVIDHTLYAHWQQGKASGMAVFDILADGQSFTGLWARSDHRSNGSWVGTRAAPPDQQQTGPQVEVLPPVVEPPPDQQTGPAVEVAPPVEPPTEQPTGPAVEIAPPVQPPQIEVTPPPPVVPVAPVEVTPPPPQPKPVVLPKGQCPAPTASVVSQANIRAGIKGDVIGNLSAGTRVQCTACDKSWCLIATNNPASTVSRSLLQFETPQPVTPVTPPEQQTQPPQQQTQPPQQQTQPPPPPAPEVSDFTGHWYVRTSTGLLEQFDIHQNGAGVVGSYTDQYGTAGQITGGVGGKTLTVQWTNSQGYTGIGTFTMHADGKSFDGAFNSQALMPLNQMQMYAQGGTWETYIPQPVDPDTFLDMGNCAGCNTVDKPDPVK